MGLAVLALLLQGLTPPGIMVARQGGRAEIVLCTGHGPVRSLDDLAGHPAKAPKSRPDAPCAYAVHGAVTAPPVIAQIAAPILPPSPPPAGARLDLAPGRGLAAPPPPSQGPPTEIL